MIEMLISPLYRQMPIRTIILCGIGKTFLDGIWRYHIFIQRIKVCHLRGSNTGPSDLQSDALPAELKRRCFPVTLFVPNSNADLWVIYGDSYDMNHMAGAWVILMTSKWAKNSASIFMHRVYLCIVVCIFTIYKYYQNKSLFLVNRSERKN